MAYPEKHLLLTLHWTHSSWPLETGQCGIRFHATGAGNLDATQARVNAAVASVETMWRSLGAKIPIQYQLAFLRLARIDTTGRYVAGTSSFDGKGGSWPIPGNGGANVLPMQAAAASTLLTAVPHGQASKGRVFLPPIASTPTAAGLWSGTDTDTRSSALATMLTSLNTALNATGFVYSTGTTRTANGAGRPITGIATGNRPDVQRRRAKGVADVRGATSSVAVSGDPGEVVGGGIVIP